MILALLNPTRQTSVNFQAPNYLIKCYACNNAINKATTTISEFSFIQLDVKIKQQK